MLEKENENNKEDIVLAKFISFMEIVFHNLSINYFHREFDDTDVIKAVSSIYDNYSVRTAKEEIAKLNIITNK